MTALDRVFDGIAWKYLSSVDAEPNKSNQHEVGGLPKAGFSRFLQEPVGGEKIRYPAEFIWLDDDESKSISDKGFVTWYDSRYGQTNRNPELRLYYTKNAVSEKMQGGDFCLFAKRKSGEILMVVCRSGGTSENQLRWLFDLSDVKDAFKSKEAESVAKKPDYPATWVLELLGVELASPHWESFLDRMVFSFGSSFPATRVFSEFARSCANARMSDVGYDNALVAWIEAEEGLFRAFERHLVENWLEEGFKDVDDFVSKSLSVQNRRKSRAGYALENHLEYIFSQAGIRFVRGAVTENRTKPDFLFPDTGSYHDASFPSNRLRMLGAKSTCKDRWRQVLAEARRIGRKHLITLEPAISKHQTDEMKASSLQLVVPASLQRTYHPIQQDWLMSLESFIREVAETQELKL